MTWQSFFDLSTMGHRHLVFVYVGVIVLQAAYFAWILSSWSKLKPKQH